MKRPRKTASKFSESVHQHLNMYAMAAGAAGVGLLASGQPAEARIVYTPTHKILTNGTLPIPVARTHDFTLSDKFYIITGSWSSQFLNIIMSGSASVVGSKGSDAAALSKGAVIGPADKFEPGKALMAGAFCETQIGASSVFGPFANTTQRYLGLKFKLKGKFHYGWARFASVKSSACNGGPAISARLTGYAYETRPGKSIKAGQTHGPADDPTNGLDFASPDDPSSGASLANPIPDTPQPATLGLLAMGSPGLSVWRREESVAATPESN